MAEARFGNNPVAQPRFGNTPVVAPGAGMDLSMIAPELTGGTAAYTPPPQGNPAGAVERVVGAAGEGFAAPFQESVDPAPIIRDWILKQPTALQPAANLFLNDLPALYHRAMQTMQSPIEAAARAYGAVVTEYTGDESAGRNAGESAAGLVGQILAAAGAAGGAVPPMARPRPVPPNAQRAAAFERQGVTGTAGAVSGSRTVQSAESALYSTPGGTGPIQRSMERTTGEAAEAATRLSESVGTAQAPEVVGAQLRQGASLAGERFAQRRAKLDESIEQAIGADQLVPVQSVESLLGALEVTLARAPKSRQAELGRAITELQNVMADAQAGVISFGDLRKIRTRIGRELDRPDVSGYLPGQADAMRQVYAALSEDIKTAAKNTGPEALKALETHDRYVRYNRQINLPILDELMRQKTDEAVYRWAISQGDIGGTRIAKLRNNLRDQYGEPVWSELVSTVVSRLGTPKPGQTVPAHLLGPGDGFSVNTFLTNYRKMSESAKKALFAGERFEELRKGLDDLAVITSSLRDAERMTNFSNTARNALYTTLGGGGLAVMTGRPGIAATAGSAVVAAHIAGRLMTSARFVKWLGAKGVKDPVSMRKHILQLGAIAAAEPELKDDLTQYVLALKSSLPPILGDPR